MRRRLLNLAASVSLLLLIALCILWWRSYRYYDVWDVTDRDKWCYTFRSLDGTLEWTETPNDDASEAVKMREMRFLELRHRTLVPFFTILPATLVALRIRAAVTSRRVAKRTLTGRCLSCGYDLRGSPERCPECGKPVGHTGRRIIGH